MDALTIIAGCLGTAVGAMAYAFKSRNRTAENATDKSIGLAGNTSDKTLDLVRELAVTHMRNVETRLGEVATSTAATASAVRESTAAINLLISRIDEPPPSGGVVTETSEDETPPLGIVRPDGTRKPTTAYRFQRRGIGDKK